MQAVVAEIRVRDRGPHRASPPRADYWTTVWVGAPGPNRTKGATSARRVGAGRSDVPSRALTAISILDGRGGRESNPPGSSRPHTGLKACPALGLPSSL
jgi:hypothetical protein